MTVKSALVYFILGTIFGFFISTLSTERKINLIEYQLEGLSENISTNIYTQFSSNIQQNSDNLFPEENTYIIEATDELVDKLKSELALVIVDELRTHKEEMLVLVNGGNAEKVNISDNDYEQYYEVRSILYDVANGAPLSFQEFTADPKIQALPEKLRNKLMGEVAMKLTSGEIDAEMFLGKNN